MHVGQVIAKVMKPLLEARDELVEKLTAARQTVSELEAELATIDRVLKAAEEPRRNGNGPKKPMHKTGKPKAKDIVGTPMTIERSEQILRLMNMNSSKEDWSASEVQKATNINSSGVNVALTYMRQEGMIRPTRRIQGGGFAYAPWTE